ncbi:MAG: aminotransferase class I/II-fold pyridoxal phosphate-dependent enzyme [Selenomonadaceae bacterium]|nr:aminotransferase class I/II-fold pyridoxal phosphate-dependent enzyme [Selenomonadaceae bacterium]
MINTMAASHAVNRTLYDPIFAANSACKAAILEHGKDKVTNATIGVVLNEDGKLSVMPTVEKIFRSMKMTEFTAYAALSGNADFIDAVKNIIFSHANYDGYFSAVATAGGTGAIHHAVANYAERGDAVLTSDWCWGNYKIICAETGKRIEYFKLFNDELTAFNVKDFADKVENLLTTQNSLLIILNTPAHNPTGYALSSDEWDNVIEILKAKATKDKKITLLVDIAYIDFAAEKSVAWSFFDKFGDLPANVLTLVSFSMSKSYALYGQRTGALAAFSPNQHVIKEFDDTNKYSCRAIWSNINNGAQVLCTKIFQDKNFTAELEQDQTKLRNMVKRRAEVFVDEAKNCGLKIVPYKGGFFIAVPAENPVAVCNELHKDLIYAVPLQYGIRFAACSTPLEKIPGVATKMKRAIEVSKNV